MFKDERGGKIALVAHCLLNQNSRAMGLAKRSSVIGEIVEFLTLRGIGIIQMPCPEIAYAGALRKPKTREQYDNVRFRRQCRRMAVELANQVREYANCGVKLELVLGVDGSPSCGVNEISGIFMEELCLKLRECGISVPFYGIRFECLKEDLAELEKFVK